MWWRLVHLEPVLFRSAVVAVGWLAFSVGILASPDVPDAALGALTTIAAVIQVVWVRPGVTPNAKVVVEAPDPIDRPALVVAGEAVTDASDAAILHAAAVSG